MNARVSEQPVLASIADAQNHARDWLFNDAAPLWASVGVCSDGQFAERLTLNGEFVDLPRRLMVQARQIFSFLTIGELGWNGPWHEIASRAVDIMIERGRGPDGHFVHLFDVTGRVCDARPDLYDHAFGLFALGHAARVLQRPELAVIAGEVQDLVDAKWSRPQGGFWEGEITSCPPYRQNPHMHMFEAGLSLYEATNDERWRALFHDLGDLFHRRFRNAQTGAVTEYFDENWLRLLPPEGDIVEPGHCLEWAWLFEVAFPDGSGVPVAEGLAGFARNHGICAQRGVAINEVRLDGSVVDANARLWPQTERLKAAVARYNRLGGTKSADEVVAAYRGLIPYFETSRRGVWYDRWLANGEWLDGDAPASSFYHIVCGMRELLNCSIQHS